MIKRQFYALEHLSHKSEASSASSSSTSDSSKASSSDADSAGAQFDDEASSPAPINQIGESSLEDESAEENENENVTSAKSGWDVEDDESEDLPEQHHREKRKLPNGRADPFTEEYVVMCKNVLKCRLCPNTICLTGDTMRSHLSSKKHARSLKHLEEGTLKVMINSDGEEEEQGETHAERYARTLASAKQERAPGILKRKSSSGRQRQRKRTKRKALLAAKEEGRTLNSANHRETDSVMAGVEMKGTSLTSKKQKPKLSKLTSNKEVVKGKQSTHDGTSA